MAAIPIGAIVTIVAAVGILWLLYTYQTYFQSLLEAVGNSIPVIGGYIVRGVTGMSDAVGRYVNRVISALIGDLTSIVSTPTFKVSLFMSSLAGSVGLITEWIKHFPYILARYSGTTVVGSQLTTMQTQLGHIVSDANQILSKPYFSEAQVRAFAWDTISFNIAALILHAGNPVYWAEITTDALGQKLYPSIQDGLRQLEDVFPRLAALETAVSGIATQLGKVSEQWVGQQIDTATKPIGQTITKDIDAIQSDLTAVRGRMLTAEVALAQAATVTADFLEKCGLPECNTVGKWFNQLSNFNSLIESGAILALLEEMIQNPQGTAEELNRVIIDPAKELIDLVAALLPKK